MDGPDWSKIPAQTPPEGVISNFENRRTSASLIANFIYATLPPMILSLILRFYVRITIHRKVGIDDWLSAAAGAVMIFYCGIMLHLLNNPIGIHMWDIPVSKLSPKYGAFSVIMTVVYFIPAMLIKASIFLSYRRLFQISTVANVMICSALVVNILFYLISFVVFLSFCIPRSDEWALGGWYAFKFTQRCYVPSARITAASGIAGTLIDIFIIIIPLFPISTLRASFAKKVGICAIFVAGSSACIFSIIGCVYRIRYYRAPEYDSSYVVVPIYAMNIGEINLGIISASLPISFVVFRGLAAKFRTWRIQRNPRQPIANAGVDIEMYQYQKVEADKLPTAPRGTLAGLGRWMPNKSRSTDAGTTGSNEVLTYVSVDYDYHQHLRVGSKTGQQAFIQRDM